MKHYLIRLDDACPSMHYENWGRMESLLDKYGIKPMVGVIPHNQDPKQQIDSEDDSFWLYVKKWEQKGWAVALHGYNHCYTSQMGLKGLNPMWKKSEFAGLPLEEQKMKIREGVQFLREHGIDPKYFFAPSHTFDENTLNALREESSIRLISDTIATGPYRYKDFIFIPQFSGQCRVIRLNGLFTFCFHPNTMKDDAFKQTEDFLKKYSALFTSFDALPLENVKKKSLFDRLFSSSYFAYRRIRGLA
jgi:predicted deacetylase